MPDTNVALITDSGCDLPDEVLEMYHILMVPLYIIWGQEELRDRVDIQPAEFYQRLLSDPVHPRTSQPTPGDFVAAAERAAANGADEALVITISSGMSSTYNSALQAVPLSPIPLHVVDSLANSMSQGFQVLVAAQAREGGGGVAEMQAAAEAVRSASVTLLMVDTLDYLHRGGRISGAARLVGSLLHLKPQLYVDHATGTIQPGERTRTRSRALDRLIEAFFEKLDENLPLHVAVLHGNVPQEAARLVERIRQRCSPAELYVSMTSPVMGVHTGPGAMALCGYAG
jgi:DegV family protein with EDD domain